MGRKTAGRRAAAHPPSDDDMSAGSSSFDDDASGSDFSDDVALPETAAEYAALIDSGIDARLVTGDADAACLAAAGTASQAVTAQLGASGPLAAGLRELLQARVALLKRELFDPRVAVLAPLAAAAAREVAAVVAKPAPAAASPKEDDDDDESVAAVSSFWGGLLCDLEKDAPQLVAFTDRDRALFSACSNLTFTYVDNDPFKGATFTFTFEANAFFTNRDLSCTLHYPAHTAMALDVPNVVPPFVAAVDGTAVDWKAGYGFEELSAVLQGDGVSSQREQAEEASGDEEDEDDAAPMTGDLDAMDRPFSDAEVREAWLGRASADVDLTSMIVDAPRPLFSALFATRTNTATRSYLEKLTVGPNGDVDGAAGGRTARRANELRLDPWTQLHKALMSAAVSPATMLQVNVELDDEMLGIASASDATGNSDSDDGAGDADDDAGGAARSKAHRAEGHGSGAPAPPPPPPECKQQ